MPIVTDVSEQVKSKGFYNIFVDGKFSFSLSENDLDKFDIKIGRSLDDEQIEDLKKASGAGKCYNYALRYLALRPRSIKETKDYLLVRKGFSDPQVNSALERLIEANYLNDSDFAQMWVRNRTLLKPSSSKMLWVELTKKGVEQDIIKSVLADFENEDELNSLVEVIRRKSSQGKYSDKQKLVEYLSRKGYKYDLIKQAFQAIESYRQ